MVSDTLEVSSGVSASSIRQGWAPVELSRWRGTRGHVGLHVGYSLKWRAHKRIYIYTNTHTRVRLEQKKQQRSSCVRLRALTTRYSSNERQRDIKQFTSQFIWDKLALWSLFKTLSCYALRRSKLYHFWLAHYMKFSANSGRRRTEKIHVKCTIFSRPQAGHVLTAPCDKLKSPSWEESVRMGMRALQWFLKIHKEEAETQVREA